MDNCVTNPLEVRPTFRQHRLVAGAGDDLLIDGYLWSRCASTRFIRAITRSGAFFGIQSAGLYGVSVFQSPSNYWTFIIVGISKCTLGDLPDC